MNPFKTKLFQYIEKILPLHFIKSLLIVKGQVDFIWGVLWTLNDVKNSLDIMESLPA